MTKKPIATSTSTYNLNDLPSDRKFEELLYAIFKYRIEDDLKNVFDSALLMTGVAEQGRDILLVKNGKNTGLVQTKQYKGNLTKPEAAREIIKFVLYYINDNTLIHDIPSFQYNLAVSEKFTTPCLNLLIDFKNEILKEGELQIWTEEVIKKHELLKSFNYLSIEKQLKDILSQLNIKPIIATDINSWLSLYTDITSEFFEVKKVIDNDSIRQVIKILNPDIEKQIPAFLKSYYNSAKSILDTVKFIGYDLSINRPQNIKVSGLYIEPLFRKEEYGRQVFHEEENLLRLHDIFKYPKNYIFLGDPGAGKSLTVKNLILKYIDEKDTSTIPFRIELRKYNSERKKRFGNFTLYLTDLLKTEYQIIEVNDKIVSHIFTHRNTIIFFDGLDEIFDITDKNEICESIIAFISNYENLKCIITSRFIGYDRSCFSNVIFEEFSIQQFNQNQIDEFVDKFYTTQIYDESERKKASEECKRQLLKMDEALKSNPLILSLMSLLALNHTIIPDSKLKVYESCTNTLVEKRDKDEKQLNIDLKIKSKQGAFGKLAFWRYEQMTIGGKVTQELSKKTIIDYLIDKNEYNDYDEAEEAARHFLEFAEKRSIYFDDNFTHKTFLEYYTADYIFRRFQNTGKINERDDIIKEYIQNSAWHIVFELLIAKIDNNLDDTEVLDKLFITHLDNKNFKINYFFLSILDKIVNVSDEQKKRVIKNSIEILLQDNIKRNPKPSLKTNRENLDLFLLLVKISDSNKLNKQIQDVIFNVENNLNSQIEEIKFYCFFKEFITHHERIWKKSYECNNLRKKQEELRYNDINLFILTDSEENNINSIIEQIKYFGTESIFNRYPLIFSKSFYFIPRFSYYIRKRNFTSLENLLNDFILLEKNGINLDILEPSLIRMDISISSNSIDEEGLKKLKNLINLYIINNDKKLDKFIELIIEYYYKESLRSISNDFILYPKFVILFEKYLFNKEIESIDDLIL